VFPQSVATKSFPFFSARRSSDLEARRSNKRERGGKRKKSFVEVVGVGECSRLGIAEESRRRRSSRKKCFF
jgi:hypothetical protein